MPTYVLPARLRATLSRPLGELVAGSHVDLGQILGKIIEEGKPAKLILVGDSVSRQATEAGIVPDVLVIDNLEKRHAALSHSYPGRRVIKAKNQPGRIEEDGRVAVERAIHGDAELVEIDGEEDLLTIVAVLAAPLGSLVVYGQPNEGVVLVTVSGDSKARARGILDQMDRIDED